MFPRSNDPTPIRSSAVEVLGMMEEALHASRVSLQNERWYRTMAGQPQIATPENPNPDSPDTLRGKAEQEWYRAHQFAGQVLALAPNLAHLLSPPKAAPEVGGA